MSTDLSNSNTRHEIIMRQAIRLASSNVKRPFASIILDRKSLEIIATGVNRVDENPLLHAETDAINAVVEKGCPDFSSMTLYTTAEPCPMCFAAILWTGIGEVVFGTSISQLIQMDWKQIPVSTEEIASRCEGFHCRITAGILADETNRLFDRAGKA